MANKNQKRRRKKIVVGTAALLISQAVFIFCSYLLHVVLARKLSVGDYGDFGVIVSVFSIFLIFLNSGVPEGVSKYIAENPSQTISIKNAGLKIQISVAIILAMIFFAAAPNIARLLSEPALSKYFRIIVFVLPISGILGVYWNFLNGLKAFKEQAVIGMTKAILRVALIFALVFSGFGLAGAIVGFSTTPVFILFLVLLIVKYRIKIEKTATPFSSLKLIRFGVPAVIFSGAITLILTMDLLFVKALLQEESATGFYASATTVAKIPYYLFLAFPLTLMPSVASSLGENNFSAAQSDIQNSLRMLLLVLLPLSVIISASSEDLIYLLFSEKYAGAVAPLRILVFGLMFFSFFATLASVLKGIGKPKIAMIFALVVVTSDVILNFALIPIYQITGAAIASSLSMFLGMVLTFIYVYRMFTFPNFFNSLIKIICASSVIYFFLHFTSFPKSSFLAEIFISLLLYLLLLFLLKEIRFSDLKAICAFSEKRIN